MAGLSVDLAEERKQAQAAAKLSLEGALENE